MHNLVIASTEADAEAAAAVEQHHAALAGALSSTVERLVQDASMGKVERSFATRDELVRWCRSELVPHAAAEESTIYRAAGETEAGRLLVDHAEVVLRRLARLVDELDEASQVIRAVAAAKALQVMFESHLGKEDQQVIPLLVGTPGVSLAEQLEGTHGLLGAAHDHAHHHAHAHDHAHDQDSGGHACGCREADGPGDPELDARAVPHAIRHSTIFGALDAVPAGGGLVLVAPHDPLPLLAQLEQRSPGAFAVEYLERGPEAWRLRFERRSA